MLEINDVSSQLTQEKGKITSLTNHVSVYSTRCKETVKRLLRENKKAQHLKREEYF